jgi:hypothetical protein
LDGLGGPSSAQSERRKRNIKLFDAYETGFRKSGLTMQEFGLTPLNEFLSLRTFREEFIHALALLGVNISALQSDDFWRSFVQHYLAVIQDCPLRTEDDRTRIVLELKVLAWSEEVADSLYPGKRVVQWNWKPKDLDEQKFICALI